MSSGKIQELGAILKDHKPTEAWGQMVLGMERAWKVLKALNHAVEEEDRLKSESDARAADSKGAGKGGAK